MKRNSSVERSPLVRTIEWTRNSLPLNDIGVFEDEDRRKK